MSDHNLENVILAQLREYPDGLSVDHLKSALELDDIDDIRFGLSSLLGQQRVIQGGNGWWYPSKAAEETVETEELSPSIAFVKPQSMRARLLEWLDSRSEQDAPVLLGDMAEMFGTNRKTMNNTILVMAKRLPKQKADKLRASVLKQEQPQTLKKTPKAKPVTKPSTEPVAICDVGWVAEVRQCLRKNLLPEPQKRLEWRDTLVEIERLFGELGIAADHRSRMDLREIGAWLSQD